MSLTYYSDYTVTWHWQDSATTQHTQKHAVDRILVSVVTMVTLPIFKQLDCPHMCAIVCVSMSASDVDPGPLREHSAYAGHVMPVVEDPLPSQVELK